MKKSFITATFVVCLHIVLTAQPGALDASFANAGKFTMPCINFNCYSMGSANAVAIQPDGKIIMVGGGLDLSKNDANWDFTITRLNTDGSLDNSLSNDGIAYVDFSKPGILSYDEILDLALQSDGKIVVVGYAHNEYYDSATNTYNHFDIGVSRLNADGTPDTSFSHNGKKLIDLSALTNKGSTSDSYDYCRAVTIKSNGKICIAGDTYISDTSNQSNYDGWAIQLKSNGQLDKSFGSEGISIFSKPASDEGIYKIGVQENDRLLLAGYSYSQLTSMSDFLAIRLDKNGITDNSFGVNGIKKIDLGLSDYCYSMAIQNDGKILLGGTQNDPANFTLGIALVRLNKNGNLDKSFSEDGIQVYEHPIDANEAFGGLALQQDGKIVQTGRFITNNYSSYNGSYNLEALRFNTNGSLDSGFGNHGRVIIDFGNWTDYVQDGSTSCAIQADGKIIVAGYSQVYPFGITGPAAVRLLVKGKHITLDAPPNQIVKASLGECDLVVNNIDPVITPKDANAPVRYELYGATTDSGMGAVSGKKFNPGTTDVIYSLKKDPLQRVIFSVTVNAVPGGALDFDGADDRVDLGFVNAAFSGQYSFETWIKVRKYSSDPYGSFIFGDERNDNGGIYLGLDSNGYITTFHPNTGFIVSSYKVPLHDWTHIAIVQSYTKLDLYANGKFVQTLLTAPNLHQEVLFNTFYLGAYTNDFENYSRHFNGQMDEIRIWRTAICPAQIENNLHCELAPEYPFDLLDYYKINQGVATCNNPGQDYLSAETGYQGKLENFALNGKKSNWVKGYIHDTCAPFTPLSLSCPGVIEVVSDSGQCGKMVDFNVTANSGCSPDVTITYSHDPGTFFPPGETWVTVTAKNGFGNETQCSFYVIVKDPQQPVLITKDTSIALPSYSYVQIQPEDVIANVTDDCGLDPFFGLSVDHSFFDCDDMGTTTVTVTATDVSGNVTTKTATVTITPFIATTSVEVSPGHPQYSDPANFTAIIHDADYFYVYGCMDTPHVTFMLNSQALGTVTMDRDGIGNLTGTLDSVILKDLSFGKIIQPGKAKVTAIFQGGSSDAIRFDTVTATQFKIANEDAGINYVTSQIIKTPDKEISEAIIPVGALIKDVNDGYRGDIRNASVTYIIEPVTAGASIIGSDSLTIPSLSLVNSNHTIGAATERFKVSIGEKNTSARFNIAVKVDNYYTASLTVPVIVKRGLSNPVTNEDTDSLLLSKLTPGNAEFNVSVMPNPSYDYFNLKVESSNKYERVNIRILDITGRLIESRTKLNVNESIRLGQHYIPGLYIAEIMQGQNKKVIKLIKQ